MVHTQGVAAAKAHHIAHAVGIFAQYVIDLCYEYKRFLQYTQARIFSHIFGS